MKIREVTGHGNILHWYGNNCEVFSAKIEDNTLSDIQLLQNFIHVDVPIC